MLKKRKVVVMKKTMNQTKKAVMNLKMMKMTTELMQKEGEKKPKQGFWYVHINHAYKNLEQVLLFNIIFYSVHVLI